MRTCTALQVTLSGDLCAIGAAAVFGIYLTIGGELRAWMPLFLYAVPVRKWHWLTRRGVRCLRACDRVASD